MNSPDGKAALPTLSTDFLNGLKRRDPAGWGRLVMTFGPIIYRWARSSGVREADAQDIMQDVFATLARSIDQFERQKESGSFRAWLATITRSRVRDFLRKEARHVPPTGGTDALQQMQSVPDQLDETICESTIASPLARRTLQLVKAEFEAVTWDAFWLSTIEGKSPALVAEQLQISLASVYQARSRVLRKVRLHLNSLPE